MRIQFNMTMESGNEAFQGGMHKHEVARIMREMAEWIADGAEGKFDLRDVNGNWVGRADFEAWEGED